MVGAYQERRRKLLELMVVPSLLLVAHFFLNWVLSGNVVNFESIAYYSVPYQSFMSGEPLFTHATQYSYYQGFPVLAFPFFYFFGTLPLVIKFIPTFFMSVSSLTMYYFFRSKYNFYRAIYSVLILFFIDNWLTFHFNELPIVIFSIALSLLIFQKWLESDKDIFLYILCLYGGFAFYTKTIHAYFAFPLLLGCAVFRRKRLERFLNLKTFSICSILLILGSAPFLFYSLNTDFGYISELDAATPESDVELPVKRVLQFQNEIKPISGEARLDTGIKNPIKNGSTVKLNLLLLLLISGLVYSLFYGEKIYSFIFLMNYLLLHYSPSGLYSLQFTMLYPLVAVIIGYSADLIPEIPDKDKKIMLAVILLLSVSIYLNWTDLNGLGGPEPAYVDLSTYEEYREKTSGDFLATNHFTMHLMATTDPRTKSFLISPQEARKVTPPVGNNVEVREYKRMLKAKNVTTILMEGENCGYKWECTYKAAKISESINFTSSRNVTIGNFRYRFKQNGETR